MKVLVTGCCGYIGSITVTYLLNNGYDVVGLDNFSNSKRDVLDKIFLLTNKEITFYEGNMQNIEILRRIFSENKITSVIDFAAFKAVGESVKKPIEYYMNNVTSVLNLLSCMKEYNVKNLVFSSSATVYGNPKYLPITEKTKTGGTTNPYGTSKLMVERILMDTYESDKTNNFCILRYFNPVGAHSSGLLGEDPNGTPANLMPYICKVAAGKLKELTIYGNDYKTKDGTGVRDYIHVEDLSMGHILALKKLEKERCGLYIYNLGTGSGTSVLDLVNTFEKVNKIKIPYKIGARRAGDIDSCYADCTKAKEELGFQCKYSLEDMVKSAWNYERKNMRDL